MLAAARLWRSSGTAHSNTPPSAVTSQPRSLALAGPNQTRLRSLHQTATLWRSLSCRAQAASSAHCQLSHPFTTAFESGKQGRTQIVVALSTKGSQASTARTYLPLSVSSPERPCVRRTVSSAQRSQLGGCAQRNQSQSALRALATDTGVPEKQRRTMAPLEAATFAEPETYAQQLEVKVLSANLHPQNTSKHRFDENKRKFGLHSSTGVGLLTSSITKRISNLGMVDQSKLGVITSCRIARLSFKSSLNRV